MVNKKRNRQQYKRNLPPKTRKWPIFKRPSMRKKKKKGKYSVRDWFFDRFKAAGNSIVEDLIKEIIRFVLLFILFKLLQ